MKKAFLLVCVAALLFSCKKSGSGTSTNNNNSNNNNNNNTPGNDSLFFVISIRDYSPQNLVNDSIVYNSANKIAKFLQYEYDTTSGPAIADSIRTVFSFSGADTIPSSYISYQDGTTDPHLLSYDGQGRIVKDTSTSGSGYVAYFSYPNNEIVSTVLFEGTYVDTQIDTLFMGSNNINSSALYYSGGDFSTIHLSYSSYNNPVYNPGIENGVGPLLYLLCLDGYGGGADYISKKQTSSESIIQDGTFLGSFNFNISLDSRARVSQYTASGATVLYTYK